MPYRLDEKTHKIYIDAPSVTQIVNEVYPFPADKIPQKYLEAGQEKGTCVHKQIEMYIKFGAEIGCTCKKKVKTHIEQGKWLIDWWKEFIKQDIYQPEYKVWNEQIMYSETLDLTGIADCIIESKNRYILIDWKTTKETHPQKEALQTWLYGQLMSKEMDEPCEYWIVNSNVKEAYELTPEQMEQGKQDALKGLQLYKEKKDKELWN